MPMVQLQIPSTALISRSLLSMSFLPSLHSTAGRRHRHRHNRSWRCSTFTRRSIPGQSHGSRLWIVAESDYSIAHSYKPMHGDPHRRLLLCPSLNWPLYRNFTHHSRQSEVLATVLRLSLTFALGCSRTNRLWRLRCLYTMTTKKLERVCTSDARCSVSLH